MYADEGSRLLCISVGELGCTGAHLDYPWANVYPDYPRRRRRDSLRSASV